MPGRDAFDYAIVRVVPRIEREEFVNAGVLVHVPARRRLLGRVAIDDAAVHARIRALAPDVELDAVLAQLAAVAAICAGDPGAGPVAALSASERFHFLSAPKSTIVQTSPVHGGLCDDADAALAALYARRVAIT